MEPCLVYMTMETKAQARSLGRALVEERLVACANVIEGMNSIYWWEGKVEEAGEAVLIAKTQRARIDQLIARVKALHSYDCPCIVVLPITGGNPDYLAWIGRETA
jgi:periplasmic divalent cation tolerance protein